MRLGANRQRLAAAAALSVLAGAIYAGTLGHDFVFDDGPEVVDNEAIRSLENIPALFTHSAWEGSGDDNPIYRPLTTATYALNYAASGLLPSGYHLANVLLHVLTSLLVLALALDLGLPLAAAFGAGALFAVHPLHVEVVANVAGRKDLLATVFTLAAVLAHARASRGGRVALAAAPAALLAAMLSKESGLACVVVIAARDFVAGEGPWRNRRARMVGLYASYTLVVLSYLAARWAVVGSLGVPNIPFVENCVAQAPASVRFMTGFAVIARGIGLLFAPVAQSPDYSYAAIRPVTSPSAPGFLAAVGVSLAALAAAGAFRRRAPALAFGLVWYLATLFPASNLAVPIGTIFGERLLYLPSVGFCLAAGAGLAWLGTTRVRVAVPWVGAAVMALLAWRAAAYASVWSDDLSLFAWGVRAQPRSAKMRQCLGAAFMKRGRPAEAVPEFQAAVDIVRDAPRATGSRHRLELGVAYEALARYDDAAALYGQILRDDPGYSDARWRLGVVQWALGHRAEAVATWQRTVELDPRHARALSDIGIAAAQSGDAAAARSYWERAVQVDPHLASAWYRLGELYEQAGDRVRARVAWSEFLRQAGTSYQQEQAEVARKLGASPAH